MFCVASRTKKIFNCFVNVEVMYFFDVKYVSGVMKYNFKMCFYMWCLYFI